MMYLLLFLRGEYYILGINILFKSVLKAVRKAWKSRRACICACLGPVASAKNMLSFTCNSRTKSRPGRTIFLCMLHCRGGLDLRLL